MGKVTEKCDDLESRSRRNNIRIKEVPEGSEGSGPRDLLAGLLQEVLTLDEKPLIDRAPSPTETTRPQ